MSINLQTYLDRIASLGIVQLPNAQQTLPEINTDNSSSAMDEYIPSNIAPMDAALPSASYTASGMMVGDAAQVHGISKDSPEETSAVSNIDTTTGGSSAASSSGSDDDETTIQTVIINGLRYLEVTRVENGNEIVTRELIGEA